MATVNKIQNQTAFTQRANIDQNSNNVAMEHLIPLPRRHYRNHNTIPNSVNMIKPEPGQGHLIRGGFFRSIGRFFKNRVYDVKSVYNGYTGKANDHQLGRTNDVGLVLGGTGIAAFLTTRRVATMPKHMEFIGLASFLTSMALWPKIGIFGPARLVHGFDADKRYIDDQGRNKSVFQDPNYVPFDLYTGRKKSENLSAIGDYMGIAKDAKNRDDITKDQMRKIANQNHTLWMLTSGFAVPTLTALLCNGFERVYEPFIVGQKAKKHDKELNEMYSEIVNGITSQKNTHSPKSVMKKLQRAIKTKSVSEKIAEFTSVKNLNKVLSESDLSKLVNEITTDAGHGVSEALAEDLSAILIKADEIVVDSKYTEDLAKNIESKFQGHKLLKNGILTLDEIKTILLEQNGTKDSYSVLNKNDITDKILNGIKSKLASSSEIKAAGSMTREAVLARVQDLATTKFTTENILPKSTKFVMTEEAANTINSIGATLETYLTRFKKLKDINALKMGDLADSQNAFYWGKLEKAFTNIIYPHNVITSKNLKTLIDNPKAIEAETIKRLESIVRNDGDYKKVLSEINNLKMGYLKAMLGDGMEEQYTSLVKGSSPNGNGCWTQRNYRTNGTQIDKFIELQTRIASDFRAGIGNKSGLFRNLINAIAGPDGWNYSTSVAHLETMENVSKVENFVTACDRIIHTLDLYRRTYLFETTGDERYLGDTGFINKQWASKLFKEGKANTLSAHSTDFFAKFGALNKPEKFQNYLKLIYNRTSGTDSLGFLDSLTSETLGPTSSRITREWIDKLRRLVGNDNKNWQYAGFWVDDLGDYANEMLQTPEARYRAQGKSPVELLNQGIKKSYNSNKWLRMFGGLFIGVFSLSILSQFFFGKKDSTIPLEKDRIARIKKEERAERRQNKIAQKEAEAKAKQIEMEAANAN